MIIRSVAEKKLHQPTMNYKDMFCLFVVLVSIITTVTPECCECPDSCVCKWITGKTTAICISAGFTYVPLLSPDTQVLNLSNNYITHLKANAFGSVGLVNLQKIFLRNMTLREIHPDSFKNMTILVEINMSDNFLSSIPKGAFAGNERLKILVLSGNPLKVLPSGQFPTLPSLRTLELESCQLQAVEAGAFDSLNSLEILNLKFNNLQSISKAIFVNLTSLKSLSLEGNPWRCDCRLRDFRNWYLSSTLPSLSPICYEPEVFHQRLWTSINSQDFACLPEVAIVDGDVVYKELGDNMTLSCRITGDQEPRVTWLFNGVPIVIGSNESFSESVSSTIFEDDFIEKWSNLSILELNEYNFGRFVCLVKSPVYLVEARVLVTFPVEEQPPTLPRGHGFWFLFTGLSIFGLVLFVLATSAVACGCMTYNRNKKKQQHTESKPNDPEKHLLDASHSRKSSCEKLDSIGDADTLKHSSSFERYNANMQLIKPMHSSQYVTAFPVSPIVPPPEQFNSITRSRTLGNVYQSASPRGHHYRSKPNVGRSTDILDVVSNSRKSKDNGCSSAFDVSVVPFATLPRKQLIAKGNTGKISKYDNMGKRVSVRGSSTMSFHDIPPPPPPPMSPKPDFDFVPL